MYTSTIFQLVPKTNDMVAEAMCTVRKLKNVWHVIDARRSIINNYDCIVGTLAVCYWVFPRIWSSFGKNVEGLSHISQSKAEK